MAGSKGLSGIRQRFVTAFALVAFAAFTTAGAAFAGHVASGVKSYTGCLTTVGGTLSLIREGDAPAKRCPTGSTEAHFSGGDITGVTVGFGLTGGGADGDVTIALDSKYALRQDCDAGQVLEWNGSSWACADPNTYTAGTGLVLDGGEFSLDSSYQLPQGCGLGEVAMWGRTDFSLGEWLCVPFTYADQACASGKFATGVDADGKLVCATPSGGSAGGSSAYLGRQINPTQSDAEDDNVGVPSDANYRTYARVTVPAGTYAVTASGFLGSEHNLDSCGFGCFVGEDGWAACRLNGGANGVQWSRDQLMDDGFEGGFTFQDVATTAGGTFTLECQADDHAPGISLHASRIVAIKVG